MSRSSRQPNVWSRKGICTTIDPNEADEIFFNQRIGRPTLETKWNKYCSNCPVCKECFEYALVNNLEGVYGNTTTQQRQSPILARFKADLIKQAVAEGWYEPVALHVKRLEKYIMSHITLEFEFEIEFEL